MRGDRIEAVGTSRDIKAYIGQNTEVIDLAGRFAMPGFIESHAHFTGVGAAKMQLELMKTRTWDEIVAWSPRPPRRRSRASGSSGRGWHQEKWDHKPLQTVEGFPDARVAEPGGAGQPRHPHARQRPRDDRQREGDGAGRHHAQDAEPGRRRDRPGRQGQPDRRLQGNRLRPRPQGARARRARHGRPSRRAPTPTARSSWPTASSSRKGITTVHDAGVELRDDRPLQASSPRAASWASGST